MNEEKKEEFEINFQKKDFINAFKNYVGINNVNFFSSNSFKSIDKTSNKELLNLLYNPQFNFFNFRNKVAYDLAVEKGKKVLFVLQLNYDNKKFYQIFSGNIVMAQGFPAVKDITINFDSHNFLKEIIPPFLSVRFYKNGSKIIQSLTFSQNEISLIEVEENGVKKIVEQEVNVIKETVLDTKILPFVIIRNNSIETTDIEAIDGLLNKWSEIYKKIAEEIEYSKNMFYQYKDPTSDDESGKAIHKKIIEGKERVFTFEDISGLTEQLSKFNLVQKDILALKQMMDVCSYFERKVQKFGFNDRDSDETGAQKNKDQIILKQEAAMLYKEQKRICSEIAYQELFNVILPSIDSKFKLNKDISIKTNDFEEGKLSSMKLNTANYNKIKAEEKNFDSIAEKNKKEAEEIEKEKQKNLVKKLIS